MFQDGRDEVRTTKRSLAEAIELKCFSLIDSSPLELTNKYRIYYGVNLLVLGLRHDKGDLLIGSSVT